MNDFLSLTGSLLKMRLIDVGADDVHADLANPSAMALPTPAGFNKPVTMTTFVFRSEYIRLHDKEIVRID